MRLPHGAAGDGGLRAAADASRAAAAAAAGRFSAAKPLLHPDNLKVSSATEVVNYVQSVRKSRASLNAGIGEESVFGDRASKFSGVIGA